MPLSPCLLPTPNLYPSVRLSNVANLNGAVAADLPTAGPGDGVVRALVKANLKTSPLPPPMLHQQLPPRHPQSLPLLHQPMTPPTTAHLKASTKAAPTLVPSPALLLLPPLPPRSHPPAAAAAAPAQAPARATLASSTSGARRWASPTSRRAACCKATPTKPPPTPTASSSTS